MLIFHYKGSQLFAHSLSLFLPCFRVFESMVKERNKTNPLGMDRVSHHMHPQLFQHDGIGEKFKKYKTNFFSVADERARLLFTTEKASSPNVLVRK